MPGERSWLRHGNFRAREPGLGRLFSVQFSDGEFNVLVPVSEGVSLGPFADILTDASIVKIFHNARFDLDFLRENGYEVANVFDTMIAEKVLTRGAGQSSSLAETLYRYFAVDLDKSQRAKFNRSWDGIWTDELVDYALSDVVHLPRLMAEQNAWLEKLGLVEEFHEQMKKAPKGRTTCVSGWSQVTISPVWIKSSPPANAGGSPFSPTVIRRMPFFYRDEVPAARRTHLPACRSARPRQSLDLLSIRRPLPSACISSPTGVGRSSFT